MLNKVQYRSFKRKDTKAMIEIITDAWKYEKMFSKRRAFHFSSLFLFSELFRSDFNQVAIIDGKVSGMIAGDLKKKKNWKYIVNLLWHGMCLLLSSEGRKILWNYGIAVEKINENMLLNTKEKFEAELAFFVVSNKVQGYGIGNSLLGYFKSKLEENKLKSFNLFTDTTCNYKFYEHKGLVRLVSTRRFISYPINKKITFYIYKGEV